MIHRLLFSLLALQLLGLSLTSSAQPDPLPVPADITVPVGPVERTAADLAAIRQLEAAGLRAARNTTPRDVSHFVMPATIRVGIVFDYTSQATFNATWDNRHCSTWLANGEPVYEVREINFRQYIKDVLPNEWGASWHTESLRAGAVAAKMFAWWRYNLLELYTSVRPQGVHVVNNTCDQFYLPGYANAQTNAAVDDTWPYRLHNNESVVEIHYLATASQCANAQATWGWPRCLPQWETQYMAQAGASWQDILYQYYSPISISVMNLTDLPLNTNLVRNFDFSAGLNEWSVLSGALGAGVTDGVFSFYRGLTGMARLRQDIPGYIGAGARLKMAIKLGNSSPVSKQITVNIQRFGGGETAATCTFTLDPNSPLQKHIIWGMTPADWPGLRIQIAGGSADDTPAYLIDNIKLTHTPGTLPAALCVPPAPGKPVILTPLSGTLYENDLNIALLEGKSNYRLSYDAAFHLQISRKSDFTTLFFDNADDLAPLPQQSLYLPGRTWYLRARQFDGVDRYSAWTPTVEFMTDLLPDQPQLSAPVGEVGVMGQHFIWVNGRQTESYKLIIVNQSGKAEGKFNYPLPAAVCDENWCSVPLDSLPVIWKTDSDYTWFIKAFNASGKVKSTKSIFRLIAAP